MAWADAVASIRARFNAGFTTLPKFFTNEVKVEPDPDVAPHGYVFFEVNSKGPGRLMSIGAPGTRFSRQEGVIYAHVFIAKTRGETEARTYGDTIGALFRFTDVDDVQCLDSATEDGLPDGKWWRAVVSVPFNYDEIV